MTKTVGYIGLSRDQREAKRLQDAQYRQQRDQMRAGEVTQHYNLDGSRKPVEWANPEARVRVASRQSVTGAVPGDFSGIDPYSPSRSRRRSTSPVAQPGVGTAEVDPVTAALRAKTEEVKQANQALISGGTAAAAPQVPGASAVPAPAAEPALPSRGRSINGVNLQPDEVLGPDGKALRKRKGGTINGIPTAEALTRVRGDAAVAGDPVLSAIRRQQQRAYGMV